MLGTREPNLYGTQNYQALIAFVKAAAKQHGVSVKCFQSNSEGDICTAIQKSLGRFDGIIINAGAYTHTSIAILDALKAVNLPTVEVHLTDIAQREPFRQHSYISLYAHKVIAGHGFDGYAEAIEYLKSNI